MEPNDYEYIDGPDYGEIGETCDACNMPVPIGGWPFCRSDRNPEGHARGVYAWKSGFSMKMQGWTRRER